MSRKVELLAPAGNPEGFYGAIHAGADAVYLAGNRFGARAYADNFTTEELVACIRYAHILGRRVYLTVNTLVKEAEFDELIPYLTPFYEAGLDGVIVQDIGVFSCIRDNFPGLELHVSTQMTLTGKYGAQLLKKMGAVRIVPARELSLVEIKEIKENTGLEIETFIHGAMCYCYSGQCLFSSILGGRSGNRGRCAQPCRLPYRVENSQKAEKECYPLSLKDMCTIEHIPQLIEAGIDSFKIEGRMKKPEYAAGVTAIYRKYIDKYYAGEDCKVSKKDLEALGNLYIRSERQNGYYYRHNSGDMVTLDSPSYSGTDEALLNTIKAKYLDSRPKLAISMDASFKIDEPAKLVCSLIDNPSIQIEVTKETVSAAMKQPISKENIAKQLGKLGDTLFVASQMQISLDDNAFYPLKSINELRRTAIFLLENLLIQENGLCAERIFSDKNMTVADNLTCTQSAKDNSLNVSVRTTEQLDAVVKYIEHLQKDNAHIQIKRIYLEADSIYNASVHTSEAFWNKCRALQQKDCTLFIALPPILRLRDENYLNIVWDVFMQKADRGLFQGFLVRSMDGLGFLKEKGYGKNSFDVIYCDAGLYIWNQNTLHEFSGITSRINGFCMPYELRSSEQRCLLSNDLSKEKVIYGRIPLMQTANCVVNTVNGCDKSGANKITYLTDRYQKRFPVVQNCIHCMNTIYNSLPLSLHGELSKWQDGIDFRLDFTIENEQETVQILEYFVSTLAAGKALTKPPFDEYTTGHEKRGVE